MAPNCIDQSCLAGLNGENQIVGMGDTGIDWLHCTFTDSAHSGPGSGPYLTEAAATGGYTYWVSTTHRKIVYYRQVDDNVDANGHGTHCAGSAVGSLQSPGQRPYCVQSIINQSINPSINQSIHQSINQLINQLINRSIIYQLIAVYKEAQPASPVVFVK